MVDSLVLRLVGVQEKGCFPEKLALNVKSPPFASTACFIAINYAKLKNIVVSVETVEESAHIVHE